jgi:Zn-finger nucleic acid-binding protein
LSILKEEHVTYENQFFCPDPDCQQPMMKQQDPSGVTLDVCPNCGNIALQPGELEAIVATVTSRPGFRTRPVSHVQRHRGHHTGHHHGHHSSSGGIFGSFFGSS